MALLKVICWAIVFITRLCFPPGKSLAKTLKTKIRRKKSPVKLEPTIVALMGLCKLLN